MDFSKTVKVIIWSVVLLAVTAFICYFLFKDRMIEISSEKLSNLTNMDVKFESYRLLDSKTLEFTTFSISSLYEQKDYRQVNKHETDWIGISIASIRLNNFDYLQFIQNKKFIATSIDLDGIEIDVYRDKTLPDEPYTYKPLFASLLRKLNTEIQVDTINIKNANIRYFERHEHSDKPGSINFTSTNAICTNLTNKADRLALNPQFKIVAQSKLMGKAPIKLIGNFDITSMSDDFTINASVGAFTATILNKILTGVLPIEVLEGEVNGVDMVFNANDDKATGTLDFQYEGVKFDVASEEDSRIKSFFRNTMAKTVLNKNNLQSSRRYKQGEIDFVRLKDKSIFNYWWNASKSGILDIMINDTGKLLNLDEKATQKN